jgi:hypothetical protein
MSVQHTERNATAMPVNKTISSGHERISLAMRAIRESRSKRVNRKMLLLEMVSFPRMPMIK